MVDINKMRKRHEKESAKTKSGPDFLKFEKGETLCMIHPQCRENDKFELTEGVSYVPISVHYSVGKDNRMVASLDPEINQIIEHPFVKKLLKKKKIKLTGKCPMQKALDGDVFDDEQADDSKISHRYLWGITPISWRKKSAHKWTPHDKEWEPTVTMGGKQIWDGICDIFFDNDVDIGDPDAAILCIVTCKGEKKNTKYSVKPDSATLKKPLKLKKSQKKALVKAIEQGGPCDLFTLVANMIKSPAEVQAMIDGVQTSSDGDDHDEEVEDDEDEFEEEELEEEEEEESEEESDEDDEEEDEEEESTEDDSEEESEEESDEEEEEESDDDEKEESDEDDDLKELDDELFDDLDNEDDEEEEEDKPAKKKKGAKKKGGKKKKGLKKKKKKTKK